jgi:hypothetical protein
MGVDQVMTPEQQVKELLATASKLLCEEIRQHTETHALLSRYIEALNVATEALYSIATSHDYNLATAALARITEILEGKP